MKKIPQTDLPHWSAAIRDLTRYSFPVYFYPGKKGPLPYQILNFLKGLEITQELAYLNNAVTKFEGYSFDLDPIKDILKDPYLDLGIYAPQIFQTITAIEKQDKNFKKVRLMELRSGQSFGAAFQYQPNHLTAAENEFFLKHGNVSQRTPLVYDFGHNEEKEPSNHLPSQIVDMRQIYMMTQMLMAPHRTIRFQGIFNHVRAFFHQIDKSVKLKQEQVDKQIEGETKDIQTAKVLSRAFMEKQRMIVEEGMDQKKPPERFETPVEWRLGYKGLRAIQMKPYDVRFTEYDNVDIPDANETEIPQVKIPVPQPIERQAQRLLMEKSTPVSVEGAVADKDRVYVTEDGLELKSGKVIGGIGVRGPVKKDPYPDTLRYYPKGKTQTERAILDEKYAFGGLPVDLSAELQMMQTNPLETRIPNMMGFFARYASFFADPAFGTQLQRIFGLNLFRNGALYHYLKDKPEYATTFSKNLRAMMTSLKLSNNIKGVLFVGEIYQTYAKLLEELAKENAIFQGEYQEILNISHQEVQELHGYLQKGDEDPFVAPHRRALHYAVLLDYVKQHLPTMVENPSHKVSQDELKTIVKCYFFIKQTPGEKGRGFFKG